MTRDAARDGVGAAQGSLALIAMLTFLEDNGWRLPLLDPELAGMTIGLSAGETPETLAGRIRSR